MSLVSSTGSVCDADQLDVMPLRVIDVEKTIQRSEAGGIYFTRSPTWHVISHTWSTDVRAFSCVIGERLQEHSTKEQSYEALFEAAGFHCHPAYQKLLEFLGILQIDEVKWTWFDAVCINQTNEIEKNHEIQHMGTYYQRAMGCYVLQHGIGRGYELLFKGDVDVDVDHLNATPSMSYLPRWFTRAWTFQEWVLPPKTTFIINLTSEQQLRRMASVILQLDGQCFCCQLYDTSMSPLLFEECEHLCAQAAIEEARGDNSGSGSARLNLKLDHSNIKLDHDPHFSSVPGRRHWFFTDDLGYLFLLRLKFQLKPNTSELDEGDVMSWKELADTDFWLASRVAVKRSMRKLPEVSRLPLVVWEISRRDSSHSEDRVLSVLKLLGVENAGQVRTGMSLEAQLRHLAKSLVESKSSIQGQKLLCQLCLVDGFGNDQTLGMSWVPQFEVRKGSWQEGARVLAPSFYVQMQSVPFAEFEVDMRCVALSDTGMSHIEADVCTGHIVCSNHPFERLDNGCIRKDEVSRSMIFEVEGQVISYMYACMFLELVQPTTCILTSAPRPRYGEQVCIAFEAPGLDCLQDHITVFLVKVGTALSASYSHMFWLVCIQEEQGSPFHKIGYVQMPMPCENQFPSSRKMLCCIGGLGHDVNKLLLYQSKPF